MIIVFGHSDDLIELEGDIVEEFGHYADDPALLAFSDGTVLRVRFADDGVWRITPVAKGTAALVVEQAPEGDDANYSDRATLDGPIAWAVLGSEIRQRKD